METIKPKYLITITRMIGLSIVLLCIIEALSGIALMMHFRANTDEAFNSLQMIIYGEHMQWFWHDTHIWSTNLIFLLCYTYVGLLLWQKRFDQYLIWALALILILCLIIESYLGNILSYSQLSIRLLQVLPLLNFKNVFLAHVIFLPILLALGFFILRKVEATRELLITKTGRSRTAPILIILLIIFILLVLIFPDLFSYSADQALPWYLAPWFALYKVFGIAGLLVPLVIMFALPIILKPMIVDRYPQLFLLAMILGVVGFVVLIGSGIFLSSQKNTDRPLLIAHNNIHDEASLQRGARNFMNYCAGCHSLQYITYEQMARRIKLYDADHEIYTDLLEQNLIFTGEPPNAFIRSAMTSGQALRWFGAVPPDLTSIAHTRGANWIYTYLNNFYVDPSRPWGVNNLVLPNTVMPDVLFNLHGEPTIVYQQDGSGSISHLQLQGNGSMTPEQFQEFTRDTVNFLAAVAQPARPHSIQLGFWVVLVLLAALLIAYLCYARARKKG